MLPVVYEDDNLLQAAMRLLKRRYGQRRKLLDSVEKVTLLPRSSLPVFDNVADLEAELGYLRYLVRSTEVWGVKSKISGGELRRLGRCEPWGAKQGLGGKSLGRAKRERRRSFSWATCLRGGVALARLSAPNHPPHRVRHGQHGAGSTHGRAADQVHAY